MSEALEARIDRLEATEEIRQLVAKYSLSLDMRDLDAHVGLFAPDIRVSREKRTGEPSPYIMIRAGMEALIDRKSFYRLVEIGEEQEIDGTLQFGVRSSGQFYPFIPAAEISLSFARSAGPGGQNVNKVNSKAILKWNVAASMSLSDQVKSREIPCVPASR